MVYLAINVMMIFCEQCLAQLSAIVSPDDTKTALLIGLMTHMFLMILGNNMVLLKELHYSLQLLSVVSYMRLTFESLLILIYGFDKCNENEISTVLMNFEVETQDFWPNVIQLVFICILLKALTVFILIIKINSTFESKRNTNENIENQNKSEKYLQFL